MPTTPATKRRTQDTPKSRTYRLAGAQLDIDPHDISANTQKHIAHLALAAAQRADFVVFPEMMLTGYHGRFDQRQRTDALDRIRRTCQQNKIAAIVGTGHKPRPGRCYIQAVVIDDTGEVLGAHSKMVPTNGDRRFCQPGRQLRIFRHKGLLFGCLICNDMWVTPGCGPYPDPRLSYQLARRGARVIFHLINSGSSSRHTAFHESNLMLRAREGQLHIVTANAAKPHSVNCSSGIVTPDGKWHIRLPRRGQHLYVESINVTANR
jgi:predicted amidohydrolase